MPITNPGDLDRRVVLQAKTVTKDAFGGAVESWADAGSRWAQKIDRGAREFRAAGVTNAEVTTVFRMRGFDGITTHHRISYGGQFYEIVGIVEGAGRGSTELFVHAKVTS